MKSFYLEINNLSIGMNNGSSLDFYFFSTFVQVKRLFISVIETAMSFGKSRTVKKFPASTEIRTRSSRLIYIKQTESCLVVYLPFSC